MRHLKVAWVRGDSAGCVRLTERDWAELELKGGKSALGREETPSPRTWARIDLVFSLFNWAGTG